VIYSSTGVNSSASRELFDGILKEVRSGQFRSTILAFDRCLYNTL
jgi:hypothetical protein